MRTQFLILLLAFALLAPVQVSGHEERDTAFPDGTGSVPEYRTTGPALVVCKPDTPDRVMHLPEPHRTRNLELLDACAYEHIQAAIDAVTEPGTRILVMPGVYREEPSAAEPTGACADLVDEEILTYDQHHACPHVQNLLAILGDDPADEGRACTTERLCRLQVEGTGAEPLDVLVDVGFRKLNGLRADRADGVYLYNFAVQKTEFNSVYVLETDGFVIDRMLARWNLEYGFLTFAVDHGLYKDCEAYGNGDSGVYPGSASDLHGARPAVEITGCDSHHNILGYSGTAGNSVYVHHNKFHHNGAGISTDSFFPDHPGLPQDSSWFVENEIYSNNVNYYDDWASGACDKPLEEIDWEGGVVCPVVPVPIGTGILIAGGNDNLIARNHIYDNWRYGTMQIHVPAPFREEYDPTKVYDTSHHNKYLENRMGLSPSGEELPNGLDFWWDEQGTGNCWENNLGGADGVSSDPPRPLLPDCHPNPLYYPGNYAKLATLVPCAQYSAPDNTHPEGCDWMETPAPPG